MKYIATLTDGNTYIVKSEGLMHDLTGCVSNKPCFVHAIDKNGNGLFLNIDYIKGFIPIEDIN